MMIRFTRWNCLGALACCVATLARAQVADDATSLMSPNDPGAVASRLIDTSANEPDAAAPFLGLASPIGVDPLFGSATATIPIQVPPGRKGLTPDVKVHYSSNGGNGLFGVGWNLPLGAITRRLGPGGPVDWSQPPVTGGGAPRVYYSKTSGFELTFQGRTILLDTCLDPTDANPLSPGCTQWKASAEEVWLEASFNQTDDSWRVTDRDGVVYTFGGVPEARTGTLVDRNVDTFAWANTFGWYLTDIEDPNGNALRVQYLNTVTNGANSHAFPQQIDYGENQNAGFPHRFYVLFGYEPRPDVSTAYRAGFADRIDARVNAIEVAWDNPSLTPIRTYAFGYEQDPDTGVSLLTSVSETLADGTPAPPATTFSYQPGAHGLAAAPDLPISSGPLTPSAVWARNVLAAIGGPAGTADGFRDVDGDGVPDFLVGQYDVNTVHNDMRLYRNSGTELAFEAANGGAWSTHLDTPLMSGTTLLEDVSYVDGVGSFLADMDGDGRLDAVRIPCTGPPGSCSWEFYRTVSDPQVRSGELQSETGAWQGVPAGALNGNGYGKVVDLDGDGLPDFHVCGNWRAGSHEWCEFYKNLGTGGDPNSGSFAGPFQWRVPPPNAGMSFAGIGEDLDGDGKPDLIAWGGAADHWDVAFNTGAGFGDWVSWSVAAIPDGLDGFSGHDGQHTTRALRDMNGDGLPDYVAAPNPPNGGEWTVYLNTGAGFAGPGIAWAGTAGVRELTWTDLLSVGAFSDVFDVNGDGIADHVQVTDPNTSANRGFHVHLGQGPRAGLLIHADNGLGATSDVTYVASTDRGSAGAGCVDGPTPGAPCLADAECGGGTCAAPCPGCSQLPFNVWVVAALQQHSGFSGTGQDLTTLYTFTGGYFDHAARQFRGFRQSLETRAEDGREMRRRYAPPPLDAESPWQTPVPARAFHLVDEQTIDPSGLLLTQRRTTWEAAGLADGRAQIHPHQRQETTYSTVGATTVTRTEDYTTYDEFNNLIQQTVSGTGVIPPVDTWMYYAAAAPCHGMPTEIVVATGNDHLSDRSFAYDPQCNLTTVQAWLDTTNETVTTTELVYDPAVAAARSGQPTLVRDGRGAVASPPYGTTLDYDSAGLYPVTLTNALGQITRHEYDLRYGKLTHVVDAAGGETWLDYDGLGRLRHVYRPLDGLSWREFLYTFGSRGVPLRIETKLREPNNGQHRLVIGFYDSWGRALETKQLQMVNGTPTLVARERVRFDAVGRVAQRAVPVKAPQALPSIWDGAPPASARGTSVQYDALDRVVRTTHPDGTYRSADYSVAGQSTTQDENTTKARNGQPGSTTVDRTDGFGRLAERERYDGATKVTTTYYSYDGLNRLTNTRIVDETTSPSGVRSANTSTAYDSLNRRIQLNGPDAGAWQYDYDVAGNLVYQNDPKSGQHVEFCYDPLNRVSRKLSLTTDAPLATVQYMIACIPGNPLDGSYLQYTYDSCSWGAGRLCRVDEHHAPPDIPAELQTVFAYDARGRVTTEAQGIQLPGLAPARSYTRSQSYDDADRLVTVSYPTDSATDEVVSATYDATGQLVGTAGQQPYASNLTYDLFGRLTGWQDAAGLVETRTFDTTGAINYRLRRLLVRRTAPVRGQSGTAESFKYAKYDAVGNLLQLRDTSPYRTSTPQERVPLRNVWDYGYDGLGRLTSARPSVPYPYVFSYDGLDSMTVNNVITFDYPDNSVPHHFVVDSGIGDTAYDGNGSVVALPTILPNISARTITYDADGRVRDVAPGDPAAGPGVHSVYDYRGERVARLVVNPAFPLTPTVTLFFGRWFDVTGGQLTRHLYLGHGRQLIGESPVAAPPALSLTSAGTPSGPPFPVSTVHADHLGSTSLLACSHTPTCTEGATLRYIRYDPYGRPWAYFATGPGVPAGQEGTPFLYTGQRWDPDAHLYDYHARVYDPQFGHFLSEDPARQGANPYAYVGWNPIQFTDPTGMEFSGGLAGLEFNMAFLANRAGGLDPEDAGKAAMSAYGLGAGIEGDSGFGGGLFHISGGAGGSWEYDVGSDPMASGAARSDEVGDAVAETIATLGASAVLRMAESGVILSRLLLDDSGAVGGRTLVDTVALKEARLQAYLDARIATDEFHAAAEAAGQPEAASWAVQTFHDISGAAHTSGWAGDPAAIQQATENYRGFIGVLHYWLGIP